MVRCEDTVCNGADRMDLHHRGIKDELMLLMVDSTLELETDDCLDLTSPFFSFAFRTSSNADVILNSYA